MNKPFKALGQKNNTFTGLETFPAPAGVTQVVCESDEFTALCPVTGAPDWYVVTITYSPWNRCVESKTVKLYLNSLRNEGMFCEALSAKLAHDFGQALKPKSLSVIIKQKPRGGVSIVSTATYKP